MTCSDYYPFSSVHLLQKWIILVTQDKFVILCSLMVQWPFWCILVHLMQFWCTSCATPWLLHDLLWLLSPFKCPFTPEMDHISLSRQIQNYLLCHGMVTNLVHFGAFWCILMHLMRNPMLCLLSPFLSPLNKKTDHLSHSTKFETLCSVMHFSAFLCILVHFDAFWSTPCATPWLLHDLLWLLSPFKCPFTPEMDHISHSGQIWNTLLSHSTVTILVHFSAFCCIFLHLMCNPMTPPWLVQNTIPFQVPI